MGSEKDSAVSIVASEQKGPGFETQFVVFVGGVCVFICGLYLGSSHSPLLIYARVYV